MMSKYFFLGLLILSVGCVQAIPPPFYLGGIQVNEANQTKWAATLKEAQMNTVAVTVYAMQGRWDSDSLQIPLKDEGVMNEIKAAKAAGLNVILILRVALDHSFEANRFLWHGMIMPNNNAKIDRWFERYQQFVLHWAKIAEQEKVDVLGVGSELNALVTTIPITKMPSLYAHYTNRASQKRWESKSFKFKKEIKEEDLWARGAEQGYTNVRKYINARIQAHYQWGKQVTFTGQGKRVVLMNMRRNRIRAHWKKIITATRTVYNGQLTYAANFDNYMFVDFWSELDFMGINAYFPLRTSKKDLETGANLLHTLEKGWQKVFRNIDSFRREHNCLDKPIMFTELGYTNKQNATIAPWQSYGFRVVPTSAKPELIIWHKEKTDYTERSLAIDALYNVVKAKNINLQGILYWKISTHTYHRKEEPFVLILSEDGNDPTQRSLAQFCVE